MQCCFSILFLSLASSLYLIFVFFFFFLSIILSFSFCFPTPSYYLPFASFSPSISFSSFSSLASSLNDFFSFSPSLSHCLFILLSFISCLPLPLALYSAETVNKWRYTDLIQFAPINDEVCLQGDWRQYSPTI